MGEERRGRRRKTEGRGKKAVPLFVLQGINNIALKSKIPSVKAVGLFLLFIFFPLCLPHLLYHPILLFRVIVALATAANLPFSQTDVPFSRKLECMRVCVCVEEKKKKTGGKKTHETQIISKLGGVRKGGMWRRVEEEKKGVQRQ